jgi:malate dehydrogenase (oxaloacetate-decarboxylating)
MKGNSVAVVTDGTAQFGKHWTHGRSARNGGQSGLSGNLRINAFPICLNVTDPDTIISVVKAISPAFGAINLEDISAPRCFEIERRLSEELDIPVFDDDQHGTAIAVLRSINSLLLVKKQLNEAKT